MARARLEKEPVAEQLRVNLQCADAGTPARAGFTSTRWTCTRRGSARLHQAGGIELGLPEDTVKRDLGRVLLKLEALQDDAIQQALRPKSTVPMHDAEQEKAALELLQAPDLLERIVADFERCGVVGEDEQAAGRLPRGRVAQARRAARRHHPVELSAAGKSSADGCGAGVRARKRSG